MVDEVLSGYDIVSPLEDAELWRLYHARRLEDDANVALRHLAADLDGPALAEALAEAGRAATVAGGCVDPVRVLDGGGRRVVLLAETGPGESLRRRLEAGPMPIAWALEIAIDAAGALGTLHDRGIVHGTLTPSQLWLRPNGGVRILGSGLRHLLETVSPGRLGPQVLAYLAPERLRRREASATSDVWSLTAILFEMITGRRAFPGESADEVRRLVLDGTTPEISGVRTGLGPELEQFLSVALERDPAARFAGMAELGDALRAMTGLLTDVTEVSAGMATDDGTRTNPAAIRRRPFRAPVSPGDTLGGFQILEQLGRGGMGMVFRARDRRLGRQAALKFLPANLDSDQPPDRFLQEAKAASALDHPNICTIYGVDETPSGATYIAMALYDGPSVKDLLEAGPLPVLEAVRIAVHVTSGLAAAHDRGIVHCDIKPGNVVIADDGTAKIVDFGISRMSHLTYVDGAGFVGTAGYAAPEQVWRRPIDHRVDLWAVGVLLYEMVAGERPFPGHGMKALMATVEEEPTPLSERVPGVPPFLEIVVGRCLARDPEDRYQTATDLLLDLERVMSELHEGDTKRSVSRRAAWLGVAAAAAGAALLAAWLLPSGVGSGGRRIALLGVVGGGAGAVDEGLRQSVEELLRFELSGVPGWRIEPVAADGSAAPDGPGGVTTALEPSALARVADEEDAHLAAVGVLRALASPDVGEIAFEVRLHGPRSSSKGTVAEARGPPGAVVSMVESAVRQALGEIGPAAAPTPAGAGWRPFADDEAASLYAAAIDRMRVLESRESRSLLERALELDPANPVVEMALADALFDLGRETEALARAEDALGHAAGAPHELRLLAHGRLLEARRETQRAASVYRALHLGGTGCALPGESEVDGVVRLATALVRASRPEEALEVVGEAPGRGDPRLDLVRAEAYHWLGRHDPQLVAATRAVETAATAGDEELEARSLRVLASAHWRLGELDRGLAALDAAREICERLDLAKGEADVDAMTGVLLYEKGELWQAKASYDRAARRYGSLGNSRAQARTLTNKALVLEQQGDLEATIDVTREAVGLFRESGDGVAELIGLVNLTSALRSRGRLDEAQETLGAAIEKMREVSRFQAWVMLHAADLRMVRGELAEATADLARAAELQEERGDRLGLALSDARTAHILRLQGEPDEACRIFERVLPVLAERATPLDHASALRDYAAALRTRGELDRAQEVLRGALAIQSSVTTRAGRSETELELAATLRAAGRSNDAETLTREAIADLEMRGLVVGVARARALLAELALDRGDLESASSEVERGRASLQAVGAPLPRMELELVALRVAAADGLPGTRVRLQALLAEATSRGLVELGLEVMLALGELELATGGGAAGVARLEGVVADARLKGLDRIADRGQAVLRGSAAGPR